MQRIAAITAYDCLGNIQIGARIRSYDSFDEGGGTLELIQAQVVQGTGEDDPKRWLRDVLVALAETL